MAASKRLVLLAALGTVLLSQSTQAQKRYVEEEEEEDPSLAMNRAKTQSNEIFEDVDTRRAVRSK